MAEKTSPKRTMITITDKDGDSFRLANRPAGSTHVMRMSATGRAMDDGTAGQVIVLITAEERRALADFLAEYRTGAEYPETVILAAQRGVKIDQLTKQVSELSRHAAELTEKREVAEAKARLSEAHGNAAIERAEAAEMRADAAERGEVIDSYERQARGCVAVVGIPSGRKWTRSVVRPARWTAPGSYREQSLESVLRTEGSVRKIGAPNAMRDLELIMSPNGESLEAVQDAYQRLRAMLGALDASEE